MGNKSIIMISSNNFPNGDAGAVRDLSYARIYQNLGYNVFSISYGKKMIEKYENIYCYSLYKQKRTPFSALLAYFTHKRRMKKILKTIIEKNGFPRAIHIYDIPLLSIEYLKKFTKKNNIVLIHDSTEWYSPCEFKFGYFDRRYIQKNILNKYMIDKTFRVIAISSYLNNYFLSKGVKSIRVPVIMSIEENKNNFEPSDLINLAYAGSPAGKDNLKIVFETINMFESEFKNKIKLHVIGLSEYQAKKKYKIDYFAKCIKFYGRIERNQVVRILKDMDFTILIRPSIERYTKAGFPTKVVESLSNGVPIICNYSSDLSLYLRDDFNSIILKDESINELKTALIRCINLSNNQRKKLHINAYNTASNNFDYKDWIKTIGKFLE